VSLMRSSKVPLTRVRLEEYLGAAIEFAAAAGQVILPYFRSGVRVDNKAGASGYDPVTEADRLAETVIRERIRARFPTHGVFGEEHGHEPGEGLTWVIDPIDGTRAFMTGMLHWGVLIALFDGEEPVLGVMHQPFTAEYFLGTNVSAEYRCGQHSRPLRVRDCEALEVAVLAATGPQYFAPSERDAFEALRRSVRLTRFGGDCYHYCMLAMGQLDLAVEAGLKPYDVQAIMPIVRGAGGIVTTWDGGDAAFGGRVIAAGDQRVHVAAMRLLESALG
jgi:myo-inositol-1(or 4)-monophosphatase